MFNKFYIFILSLLFLFIYGCSTGLAIFLILPFNSNKYINKPKVIILPFNGTGNYSNLDTVSKSFEIILSSGLSRINEIIVIENSDIQKILKQSINEEDINITNLSKINTLIKYDKIITGDVSINNNEIEINYNILSNSFDKLFEENIKDSLDNIFSLNYKIIVNLIDKLGFKISEEISLRLKKLINATKNFQAYLEYIKGKDNLIKENFELSIDNFKQAIKLDSNYELAQAEMCIVYILYAQRVQDNQVKENYYKLTDSYLNELKGNLPEIFKSKGLLYFYQNNNENSRFYFEKALKSIPNDPLIFLYLGKIHQILGNNQEAIRNYRIYLSIKPYASNHQEIKDLINQLK